jgi:uncharacterized DUF497 family protein
MVDSHFEWDDAKASANLAKHGVTFDAACGVFRDPFAIDFLDERQDYGEDRYAIIGMVEGRLLYVAYTIRDDRKRIISARGASSYEQRWYHEEI